MLSASKKGRISCQLAVGQKHEEVGLYSKCAWTQEIQKNQLVQPCLEGNKVIGHTWAVHCLRNAGGVASWEGVGFHLEGSMEFSEEAILKQCLERVYVVK